MQLVKGSAKVFADGSEAGRETQIMSVAETAQYHLSVGTPLTVRHRSRRNIENRENHREWWQRIYEDAVHRVRRVSRQHYQQGSRQARLYSV